VAGLLFKLFCAIIFLENLKPIENDGFNVLRLIKLIK
jgi:hypothetical protein